MIVSKAKWNAHRWGRAIAAYEYLDLSLEMRELLAPALERMAALKARSAEQQARLEAVLPC